jgi:transcriptional regulator with XRE-family HTH domain
MAGRKLVNKRIEEVRTKRGLTQLKFADALGLTGTKARSKVNNWEQGACQIKSEDLIRIAKAFNVSADYLLGLSPDETTDPNIKNAILVTGLSEQAIANIRSLKGRKAASAFPVVTDTPINSEIVDCLSRLLVNERFISSLSDLRTMDIAASDVISETNGAAMVNEEQLQVLRLLKFEIKEKLSRVIDDLYPTENLINREG